MFTLKEKVTFFAITTRFAIIILSAVSNALLPDHIPSDVFIKPKLQEVENQFDKLINILFGGLLRWDAHYFTHISQYGYTYENTLAFFPLFPLFTHAFASLLHLLLLGLNCHSITLISAVLFNFFVFVKTPAILYDLTLSVFKNERLAYKAAIFYCVNPASIFFTAPYSETTFSFLSFYGMKSCLDGELWKCSMAFGLSSATRSNGLLNIGFIVHKVLRSSIEQVKTQSFLGVLLLLFSTVISIAIYTFLSLIPFTAFQLYGYILFCNAHNSSSLNNVEDIIVDYGKKNGLLLPGQSELPWCSHKLPLSYQYIQYHYWNVGFLNYYHWKQIPNFILAAPIICITLYVGFVYLRQNKSAILNLGLHCKTVGSYKEINTPEIFVFVIHIVGLTMFCIFFVHIQVTTRMLASSSPVLYWFSAYLCDRDVKTKTETELQANAICSHQIKNTKRVETQQNLCSYWKVFLFDKNMFNTEEEIIRAYYLSYMILGTVLFSNFFPWT